MAHQVYHLNTLAVTKTPIALIGLARSGKDFLIQHHLHRTPVGLSDPMVDLIRRFSGTVGERSLAFGKNVPGYRRVLQLWGQWGRGLISEAYPWTPERLAWLESVRLNHAEWFADWRLSPQLFGRSSFWIDGAVRRCGTEIRYHTAISNLRWSSDVEGVPSEWPIILVVRPYDDAVASLRTGGESPDIWQDESERLASGLSSIAQCDTRNPQGYDEIEAWDAVSGVFFNGSMDTECYLAFRESMARFPEKKIYVDMNAKPAQAADA